MEDGRIALLGTAAPPAAGHPRVLVIEDDDEMRGAIREIFLMYGFEVNVAAEAAVSLVELDDYEVVVTDVRLPGMSGLALARHLEGTGPEVVVVTAFPEWRVYEEARAAGVLELLIKPVSLPLLAKAVEEAAARTRAKRIARSATR